MRQVITSFAGLRAHEDGHEFIIGEAADARQFIDVAGIESPGLSSAPAIGVMVADLLRDRMNLTKKADFPSCLSLLIRFCAACHDPRSTAGLCDVFHSHRKFAGRRSAS